MITYKNINKEFVAPVELQTLQNSFNTLEKGHQEAVKTASTLKTQMAELDINEAEEGWRQNKINEIQTTIDNNIRFGNMYSALDDIIAKAGDLSRDPGMIGRLKSQKAYKEYQTKVDAMDIPEEMKQMYKEENPYHYEDGAIDKNTGKVTLGAIWKPNTTPVKHVSEVDIQKHALLIAAKESGINQTITFLDANGKETRDPSKSFDGNMYKKTGVTYERLPEDKIARAYKIAIDSIPGAEASLRQDYKYNSWLYDKTLEKNKQDGGDIVPYIKGYTDKNGNIYTYDQWLRNKINNFADVSAYNHVKTNIDFGTALQTYNASKKTMISGSNVGTQNMNDNGFGTFLIGTKEVEGNAFAGTVKAAEAANKVGLDIFNKYFKDLKIDNTNFKPENISDIIQLSMKSDKNVHGPGGTINWLIKTLRDNGTELSTEDKVKLTNAFMGYYSASEQKNQMIKSAGNDADGLRFSKDIANNTFTNDNKYSKSIINYLNDIYKYKNIVEYKVGSQILEQVSKQYNTDITGLRKLGFNINKLDDESYSVNISADNRNLLPKFAYEIRKANDIIPGTIGGWLENKFTTEVDSTNFYEYGVIGERSRPYDSLVDLYTFGLNAGANAENKVGVSKGMVTYHGVDGKSYGELFYREQSANLGLKETELQNLIERQNLQVDNMFAGANFDSGLIEEIDIAGNTIKNVINAQDAKKLIQKIYSDNNTKKDVSRSVLIPSGNRLGQPKGYTIGFVVPKGFGIGDYKEGEYYRFNVYGTIDEEINYDPSYNPDIIANNKIQASRATGGTIENFGYNDNLGDTRLQPTLTGEYKTALLGKEITLNEQDAQDLTKCLLILQRTKINYWNGIYHDTEHHAALFNNSIVTLCNEIATITNKPIADVIQSVYNYINDGQYE